MPRLTKVDVVYRLANKGFGVFKVAKVAEIVDLGHSSIWKVVNS